MIQWQSLENKLTTYIKNLDSTRTPEKVAIDIENMYIDAIVRNAQDSFGNRILNLKKFGLMITLRSGLKSALNVKIPNIPNLPKMPQIKIPNIDFGSIKLPKIKIPDIDIFNIPDIKIPKINIPKFDFPNVNLPDFDFPDFNLPSLDLPAIKILDVGIPSVKFSIPGLPKMPDFDFNGISIDFDKLFPIRLNLLGALGLTYSWSGALLSGEFPPPGSVKVVSNVVTSPGKSFPMNVGGPDSLVPELMKCFKNHVKTIGGICTSLTPVGTNLVPVQFPWIGIK